MPWHPSKRGGRRKMAFGIIIALFGISTEILAWDVNGTTEQKSWLPPGAREPLSYQPIFRLTAII